ncbi:hypothetical protein Hanom_Chr04g00347281 [Helianthus anomalus]
MVHLQQASNLHLYLHKLPHALIPCTHHSHCTTLSCTQTSLPNSSLTPHNFCTLSSQSFLGMELHPYSLSQTSPNPSPAPLSSLVICFSGKISPAATQPLVP